VVQAHDLARISIKCSFPHVGGLNIQTQRLVTPPPVSPWPFFSVEIRKSTLACADAARSATLVASTNFIMNECKRGPGKGGCSFAQRMIARMCIALRSADTLIRHQNQEFHQVSHTKATTSHIIQANAPLSILAALFAATPKYIIVPRPINHRCQIGRLAYLRQCSNAL
jgi:hypothetical protein